LAAKAGIEYGACSTHMHCCNHCSYGSITANPFMMYKYKFKGFPGGTLSKINSRNFLILLTLKPW